MQKKKKNQQTAEKAINTGKLLLTALFYNKHAFWKLENAH